MEKLHHGAKWQFRFSFYSMFLVALIFLLYFLVEMIVKNAPFKEIFISGAIWAGIACLVILVLAEIYATMSYNRWFYEFTDEELRLERGIIWKKYSNIPYQRIQNIEVHRGIIARMFGFSTLIIQTAGFSGPAGAEGNIPAIEIKHAEKMREFVMKKITTRSK